MTVPALHPATSQGHRPETETILRSERIASLVDLSSGELAGRVRHAHSLAPIRVEVPPLPTGGYFFDIWPTRELPEQGMWKNPCYDSFSPPLFVVHGAMVHSSAGIIAVGDAVLSETLANTSPDAHCYRGLARGIALRGGAVRHLRGVHISVLAAGEANYRHAMLSSLARLSAVPDNYLAAATSLLLPEGATTQAEALGLLDLLPSLELRAVSRGETLLVDTLIFPLSVCGEAAFHPCVRNFYHRLSANVPPSQTRLPRRIYIDTRGTGLRPLLNEDRVMHGLAALGFEPVRLDGMSLANQIRLFRHAEAIVAPHGTALTNLGFARPGCVVVELQMDAYVDWSYRHLAALGHLRYDCVVGRAPRPWRDLDLQFHATAWEVSVNHVIAAVAHSVKQLPLAA